MAITAKAAKSNVLVIIRCKVIYYFYCEEVLCRTAQTLEHADRFNLYGSSSYSGPSLFTVMVMSWCFLLLAVP